MIKLNKQITIQSGIDGKIVLAADLGGTNLRMAAINRYGEILYRTKRVTPKSEKAEEIVQTIVDAAKECQQSTQSRGNISAIAAAVPGTVNIKEGLIIKAPNLPALGGFNIGKALKAKLGITCLLENDANAAAVGENWLGASEGVQTSICVTLGTGVGGGIIIDGRVWRGIDGSAGEIGHICVEPDGAECGCGSHGCVEQYSSATGIVRLARQLSEKFPDSELNQNASISSMDIYNAAKINNDELALEVFRQQGFYLGIMLAGLINVLNPEVIIIGGGAAAAWDLFIPHILEQVRQRAYREPVKRVKIVRAFLEDDAGILGAARLAFESVAAEDYSISFS